MSRKKKIPLMSELLNAVRIGKMEEARALLAEMGSVEAPAKLARVLLAAIEDGRRQFVEDLLDRGVDVNGRNTEGWTPLLMAAQHCQSEIAQLLIARGADTNSAINGWSVVTAAVGSGDLQTLRSVISGADLYARSRYDGWTPLRQAAESCMVGAIRILAAADQRLAALSRAVLLNEVAVARLLLAEGADVNQRDVHATTPLEWAVLMGRMEMAKLLLAGGADPNSRDITGRTSLMCAAERADEDMARVLVDAGGDVNAARYMDVSAPLHDGETILMAAASRSAGDPVVRFLLARGADLTRRGRYGQTALSLASGRGLTDIVETLLDAGADPNSRDDDGETPLMAAAKLARLDAIRALLAHGADVNAVAANGYTAVRYADWDCARSDAEQLLREAGAIVEGPIYIDDVEG
jgi:ankyrin repeat protein